MGAFDMFGSQAYPGVPAGGTVLDYGQQSGSPFGDPKTMALLGLAQGLLNAGAPHSTPVGFGGALSQGIGGALQGAIQGHQLQMQEAKANAPINMSPGGVLVDPATKQPIFQAPFRPQPAPEVKAPTSRKIRIGNEEVTQEFDPQSMQWKEVGRGPAFSDKPTLALTLGQETEFNKGVGKEMADQYAGLLRADMNAPATISKYQRLGSLLGQVNTGKFKGATTDIKAAAKGLGIDLSAMGVTDDVAPAQASRALSNQLALELRNPAGGAGMPGAMSDKDREFLTQSVPSLENDPNAIGKMVEYRVKIAQREQEVAKKAREYRRKNGRFDEGFYDELAAWSAQHPLFPDAGKPAAPRIKRYNPQTGKIE